MAWFYHDYLCFILAFMRKNLKKRVDFTYLQQKATVPLSDVMNKINKREEIQKWEKIVKKKNAREN